MNLTVTVNGEPRSADVEPRFLLVHLLRDTFGLTARTGAATRRTAGHASSCSTASR
jgi:aerobic-type carbon monoxide dehydrogenase small subunit (CoxS/CutS family)